MKQKSWEDHAVPVALAEDDVDRWTWEDWAVMIGAVVAFIILGVLSC